MTGSQPGGGGKAAPAGQKRSEPHSLVVPSLEDHAQALLTTPSPQVSSASTPLSLVQARGGGACLRGGLRPQCPGAGCVGHTGLEGAGLWSPPPTMLRLLPSLRPPLFPNGVTCRVAMLGALVTSQ